MRVIPLEVLNEQTSLVAGSKEGPKEPHCPWQDPHRPCWPVDKYLRVACACHYITLPISYLSGVGARPFLTPSLNQTLTFSTLPDWQCAGSPEASPRPYHQGQIRTSSDLCESGSDSIARQPIQSDQAMALPCQVLGSRVRLGVVWGGEQGHYLLKH